ncbi:hypothetical protein MPSI1_001440 [Malassezia psittaci]|uniref:Sexual differentiation process protein ISP4 n=1 Tax=Malassezia psittaci TaxID=1821823 RepID=A0AAF0F5L6_9BASI|nr:hypothetical protein MPSI1_001440 [Malassezia psittaci]
MSSEEERHGHGRSNSYSRHLGASNGMARLRHIIMDRDLPNAEEVPDDASHFSLEHNAPLAQDWIPEEESIDDVFAFAPPSVRVSHLPQPSSQNMVTGPWELGRVSSFEIPRDETETFDEDIDQDIPRYQEGEHTELLGVDRKSFDQDFWNAPWSAASSSMNGGWSKVRSTADGVSNSELELTPHQPTGYGTARRYQGGITPTNHRDFHRGLHRSESAEMFNNGPSTAHSIAKDSVRNHSSAEPWPNTPFRLEDGDGIPLHELGKRDPTAEPHDQYADPDPRIDPEEDSPYPEVRASVSNTDDPTMPAVTIRMWAIALLLSCIGGAVNTFLSLRYPSPTLSPVVLQLIAYFIGKFLAWGLPIDEYILPNWLGGGRFTLNPGAFNIKEHALISIMIGCTISQAYAINFLLASELPHYYGSSVRDVFQFIFTICSQIIGYGIAGFAVPFLVNPADMVWPQTLLTSTILNTLHAEEEPSNGGISRIRWFTFTLFGTFLYTFIPTYLFQALSQMCWTCWIAKDNIKLNITNGIYGMGLTSITLDWSQVAYLGSPLVMPWWTELNMLTGFVLLMWIVAPIMYFGDVKDFAYFPFNSSHAFDRSGQRYDLHRVMEPHSYQFDGAAYNGYSPVFLPTTFVISYFTGFMTISAILVHSVLNHGEDFLRCIGRRPRAPDDVHAQLMRSYKKVPTWWYQWLVVICLVAILVVLAYVDIDIKPVEVLLALVIPAVYALPSGYVYALSGQMIGTNVVADLVAGYLFSGQPQAFLLFKTLTVQTLLSCLNYAGNMKIGHYMKVPPRAVFAVQVIGSIIVACVQVGVKKLMVALVPDLCSPQQRNRMTCQSINVYFTSSLLWGVVGPRNMFASGAYNGILWGLLLGLLLPILVWLVKRRYPNSWIRLVSVPVITVTAQSFPASTSINFTAFFVVAFIFQYYLKKYYFRWWSKYNFVTANALDAGVIISELLLFFVIQLPSNNSWELSWWGNSVVQSTADAQQRPLRAIPPRGL